MLKVIEIAQDELEDEGLELEEAGELSDEKLRALEELFSLEAELTGTASDSVRVCRELGAIWETESELGWHWECIASGCETLREAVAQKLEEDEWGEYTEEDAAAHLEAISKLEKLRKC